MRLKTPLLALAALAGTAAVAAPAIASADPYDHGNGRYEQGADRGYQHDGYRPEYRAHRHGYGYAYAPRFAYGYRHYHHHVRFDYRHDYRR